MNTPHDETQARINLLYTKIRYRDDPDKAPPIECLHTAKKREKLTYHGYSPHTLRYLKTFLCFINNPKHKTHFNYAAFFFGSSWMFYRQMYWPGFVYGLLSLFLMYFPLDDIIAGSGLIALMLASGFYGNYLYYTLLIRGDQSQHKRPSVPALFRSLYSSGLLVIAIFALLSYLIDFFHLM